MFALAEQFAKLMDANKYAEAGALMAEGCRYVFRGTVINGRDAILKTYIDNFKAGEGKLDEIQFFSEVEKIGEEKFKLKYLDRIRKGAVWHEHRCEQKITFDGSNLISEIEHVDLPGEVEALHAFYKTVGL